jgi:hypothetical protein
LHEVVFVGHRPDESHDEKTHDAADAPHSTPPVVAAMFVVPMAPYTAAGGKLQFV